MELTIHRNYMQEVPGVTAAYPYSLNRADSREIVVPWHWHEETEFGLVRQGALRVHLAGRAYEFSSGEGFFLNANVLHSMEPASRDVPVRWDSHMVHPMLLGAYSKSIFDSKYIAPLVNDKRMELAAFRAETDEQKKALSLLRRAADAQEDEFSEFETRNLFSEIWLCLLREQRALEQRTALTKPVSQERIQQMLAYINAHYQQKLTLDEIAASAIISKRECLRCFQSCIGKTPFAYLMDYRVQMAEQLLRTSDLPVTEIALQTGFSNSAYFSKVFRELRAMSPSQYRRASAAVGGQFTTASD